MTVHILLANALRGFSYLKTIQNTVATVHVGLRKIIGLTSLTALVILGGCSSTTAFIVQNTDGALKPANVTANEQGVALMLKGADVVAYFTEGKYRQGVPKFQTTYEGVNFRFANAEHQALFVKEPMKYMPMYNGYCANGMVYGIPWGGNADSFKFVDGKLYMFGGQGSVDGWNLDEKRNLVLAKKYWNEEVKGSNSFIQRAKRLVFNRVPHYLSGEELAEEVARKKPKI
jgi:YHS domain-containing protein